MSFWTFSCPCGKEKTFQHKKRYRYYALECFHSICTCFILVCITIYLLSPSARLVFFCRVSLVVINNFAKKSGGSMEMRLTPKSPPGMSVPAAALPLELSTAIRDNTRISTRCATASPRSGSPHGFMEKTRLVYVRVKSWPLHTRCEYYFKMWFVKAYLFNVVWD